MKIKEQAIFYFQDKLSKFCPADKTERPNGYEIAMFQAGAEWGYDQAVYECRGLDRDVAFIIESKKNKVLDEDMVYNEAQPVSKWNLSNHITGKVYDLTQENMNAMIADVEMLHTDSLQNYRESLEAYQGYIKSLQVENARLREALEQYTNRHNEWCASLIEYNKSCDCGYPTIAREALKTEK